MINEIIKTKVTQKLIKNGNNINDVEKMIATHFDYAIRVYPNATIKELANIIRTIY